MPWNFTALKDVNFRVDNDTRVEALEGETVIVLTGELAKLLASKSVSGSENLSYIAPEQPQQQQSEQTQQEQQLEQTQELNAQSETRAKKQAQQQQTQAQ